MGIEEIEKKYILQHKVNLKKGVTKDDTKTIADFLELKDDKQRKEIENIVQNLFKLFMDKNATLVEINPLGILEDGSIKICDSKIKIDDNAQSLQKEIFKSEDLS